MVKKCYAKVFDDLSQAGTVNLAFQQGRIARDDLTDEHNKDYMQMQRCVVTAGAISKYRDGQQAGRRPWSSVAACARYGPSQGRRCLAL